MRIDYETIIAWIPEGARVLDLGCGTGELLAELNRRKQTRGVGMEISTECVAACISRGVSAYQGDLDQGLADLRSDSYDYVVLHQTLQSVRNAALVMAEAARVGRRLIVGFPNFGRWDVRLQVLAGRTPRTPDLPFEWYNTPNLHFFSLLDFRDFCREQGLRILREAHFVKNRRIRLVPNARASASLFELEPRKGTP